MKISEQTISVLAQTITGDNKMSPYRSGPELIKLFNQVGYNEVYSSGFPSRWRYCEDKLRELNNTTNLNRVFELALDPRNYLESSFSLDVIADNLNKLPTTLRSEVLS